MIDRYSRPGMAAIWTLENKYKTWLEVEILAAEAWAELGTVPKNAAKDIRTKAAFDPKRIAEIEEKTRHDVIAFLTNVAEHVGPSARYLHWGLTSSDMLDTANAVIFKQAMEIIINDVDVLMDVIKKRAFEHRDTVMVGRSHGIHAEPVTFGLKLAIWYDEMRRNRRRIENAKDTISYGKISGAVGTFAHVDPRIESYVCEHLGLKPAPASNQIIQRDRYAEVFCALAVLASSIEKIATEVRHLQRTEVLEAEEYFRPGQKGSSAMPHKRNPILSENLCGLARLIRSYAIPALENVTLWHERDISHSSVERVTGPDAFIGTDFILSRLTGILDNLIVYPDRMKHNLNMLKGLIFSQQVLLILTQKGVSREESYGIVQKRAMEVWEGNGTFKERLLADQDLAKHLAREEIEAIFDINYHLKHVKTIFERVFGADQ
ncbi:MAG: adenylosuccinate lyase [Deltaproteobacteria bacterium]|nr:adenylosuccinate lyase [Deltaproteobacteria bacterium]MBW1718167.1 adenylosuccinate lyase [Deltaproteobacteria bacterium]MBW1932235.1 adenylosuccinate lyase [Deltaproteobacteria bacterium]MBW1937183.1 adenylosuccinate lyase [Deltaproteobacteria bacterium]MBW1964017.1 adenylosuccinate lyase [Deltaproteobacteria bacterium]